MVASARLRDWEKTKDMFSVKYLAKDYKFKVSWKHHLPMILNGGGTLGLSSIKIGLNRE